jgi:hypoxanthine phosphoribosyltransferase
MEIPKITFPKEAISYVTPSWDDLNQLAFKISQEITQSGKKFDRIVTLAKGGWPMTRSLVDYLEVDEVASIGIKFYAGINTRFKHPHVYQNIPVAVAGEKVLLFDDVADTGESLKFAVDYLKVQGVGDVTTATLFYKPHSTYKPDFYGYETSDWIIFPYDGVEAIRVLGSKWVKQGLKDENIIKRYKQLNLPRHVIDFYSQRFSK